MIILKKRSDLLAQSEVLNRFMSYAHQSFPDQIDFVSLEDQQAVLASVYGYKEWSQIVFDLNLNNFNKVESVSGNFANNNLFCQALKSFGSKGKVSAATSKLLENLIKSIVSLGIRSDEMYFAWYQMFHESTKLVDQIKSEGQLFNVNDLDLDDLLDLNYLNLVLSHYSRSFKLSEPEVINQWVLNKSDLIDKKIKHQINPKIICELLGKSKFFDSFYALDASQNERDMRYGKTEKIQLSFPAPCENVLYQSTTRAINQKIEDEQLQRIHRYLIDNHDEINSNLESNNLPTFKKKGLTSADVDLINSYIKTMLWVMNQIVDIPNYYSLNDICLNHNGLFVVKSCYRADKLMKPYRSFCRVNHRQPTINFKKMITSFDMTKLIYVYLDQLKSQIHSSFYQYITALNGAFDQLGIKPDHPISNDIYLDDISVRIDRNFSQNENGFSFKN